MLPLVYLDVQRAKTAVAMRLERRHVKGLGQCKGLTVVGFGLDVLWGLTLHGNGAQEPQGIGFLTTLLMGAGKVQSLLCLGRCFIEPAGAGIRLAQIDS